MITDIWLTDAERRVLLAADETLCVMMDGSFSGAAGSAGITIHNRTFESPRIIRQCIARGFLAIGSGFNEYVLTDHGRHTLCNGNPPKRRPRRVVRIRLRQMDMFEGVSA